MTNKKDGQKKTTDPRFSIRSLSLTPEAGKALDLLAQDASDYIGWTVSGSAIVRALLTHADRQSPEWQRSVLFPLIESEIQSGTVWGKKK